MFPLTTSVLARACRIFMDAAYPEGPSTLPVGKLPYLNVAADDPLANYLPPAPLAQGVCQTLGAEGYSFRLGSSRYPNLKLRVQCVGHDGAARCVFSVDTHDAFSDRHFQPPADHPDAPAWLALQAANQELKEKIETAWESAGILTFNKLLREELEAPSAAAPV
jgi:hypothetical protein